MPRSPDLVSLVAGVVLVAFGGVLLADAVGAFDLRLGAFGPLALAAVGAVLLASGLGRGD